MADHVSRARRSAMMGNIRGKDTAPELLVRKAAHRLGYRFRLHDKKLPGRPDLVFPKWRTAMFVNGCFWHGHSGCKRAKLPKSNVQFWEDKVSANIARDAASYDRLESLGWKVAVLWQCEVRTPEAAAEAVKSALSS
jgi:DNA mismatch endonuclease, patch repair protein